MLATFVALGASQAQGAFCDLVLAGGLKLSVIGIVAGSPAALALARLASGLLHEVQPHDPMTFAVVPVVLLGVALLASYLPARRATRVDPLAALRAE